MVTVNLDANPNFWYHDWRPLRKRLLRKKRLQLNRLAEAPAKKAAPKAAKDTTEE
jgi:hypothetical protein